MLNIILNFINNNKEVVISLLNSLITLVVMFLTLRFNKKQLDEERKLNVAPYFQFIIKGRPSRSNHDINILAYSKADNEKDLVKHERIGYELIIKNIGRGPALSMLIDNISYNNNIVGDPLICGSDGTLPEKEEFATLVDFTFPTFEIKDKFTDYPRYTESGTLSIRINFNDILGNEYEQNLEFSVHTSLTKEKDNDGWKYDTPEIQLMVIGERKQIK